METCDRTAGREDRNLYKKRKRIMERGPENISIISLVRGAGFFSACEAFLEGSSESFYFSCWVLLWSLLLVVL